MSDYNSRWDKRDEDEDPRWLPFIAIMLFAALVTVGGGIVAIGQAGIAKVRGWA